MNALIFLILLGVCIVAQAWLPPGNECAGCGEVFAARDLDAVSGLCWGCSS